MDEPHVRMQLPADPNKRLAMRTAFAWVLAKVQGADDAGVLFDDLQEAKVTEKEAAVGFLFAALALAATFERHTEIDLESFIQELLLQMLQKEDEL